MNTFPYLRIWVKEGDKMECFYGDDIRIRKIDDNTYTVDVAVQVSKTFFAWIVGTQGKVKIKAPEKVVTEFSDFVAKIKEVY